MNSEKGIRHSRFNFVRKLFEAISPEAEPASLDLVLSTRAQQTLFEIALRPNPRLSEVSFLGIGSDNIVTQIITRTYGFSPSSGLFQDGFSGSQSDIHELKELFDYVFQQGQIKNVLILGHLHPSGNTKIQDVTFSVEPSDDLLEPSGKYSDIQSDGDIAFYRAFKELNQQFSIPYSAIVANTPEGPKIKIYDIDKLIQVRKYKDLNKIPQVTILLEK